MLHYHHSEIVTVCRQKVVAMISELCEGEPLGRWIGRHRGEHLRPYAALHVLYNRVRGLKAIHALGAFHANVHTENILIQPMGVRYDVKRIDFYHCGKPAA